MFVRMFACVSAAAVARPILRNMILTRRRKFGMFGFWYEKEVFHIGWTWWWSGRGACEGQTHRNTSLSNINRGLYSFFSFGDVIDAHFVARARGALKPPGDVGKRDVNALWGLWTVVNLSLSLFLSLANTSLPPNDESRRPSRAGQASFCAAQCVCVCSPSFFFHSFAICIS